MEKNFIDYIRIFCRSGHGGAGSKHFMRTKYNAMAGPDGGDGGRGAHIILRGSSQLWTLLHLRYYKNVLAEDGQGGDEGDDGAVNRYDENSSPNAAGTDADGRTPEGRADRDGAAYPVRANAQDGH